MTETFTNPIAPALKKEVLTNDDDDLDDRGKRTYTLIAAKLNQLQLLPKEATVQKILSYSKSKR